jgi:hypothetical protein
MRKARQGVDALLPGGYASAQWSDEEMVDLVNEAYEGMQREFRLVHKKWGLITLNTDSAAFTREGETYTPATSLVHGTTNTVTLPPDFAELVRIKCTSNRSIRYFPAEIEQDHWIDSDQAGWDDTTNLALAGDPAGLVFYYDVIGNRTLYFTPPTSGSFDLEIDYIPMFRPMAYTNLGTIAITNGDTAITGTNSTFTDGVYSSVSNQAAEIIVGASDPQSNVVSVTKDYPAVATLTSNTAAVLASNYSGTTVSAAKYILTMAPVFPREYHRWLARLASSLMLSKVNPDIAEKYFTKFTQQFQNQINPAIRRRQSQMSPVVEDADEFGLGEL